MSGDPYKFWQQIGKAQSSAYIATPASYKIMDQFASMFNQLSNSGNMNVAGLGGSKLLDLSDKMNAPGGVLSGMTEKIQGILTAGIIQSFYGGPAGAVMAQAQQAAQKEEIKKVIDKGTEVLTNRLKLLARIIYDNNLAEEQSKQLNKVAGTSMGGAQGYSDSEIEVMQDITYTHVTEPDDLETA